MTASDASFPETRYEKRVAADIRGKGEKAKRGGTATERKKKGREKEERERDRGKRDI